MRTRISRARTQSSSQSGLSLIEYCIGGVFTLAVLMGAITVQKTSIASLNRNEIASEPLDEITRIGERLDTELRRASAGSLQVPGSPFSTPPTSGTTYNTISYRRVLYDSSGNGSTATYLDTNYSTLSLSNGSLQLNDGTKTIVLVKSVNSFSLVYSGTAKTLTITMQISKTPTGGSAITKTLTRTVFLRNS